MPVVWSLVSLALLQCAIESGGVGKGVSTVHPPAAAPEGSKTENRDPEKAKLITTDVDHFWRAYDLARPEDKLDVFDREYFETASAGLKDFMQARDLNPCTLWDAIKKRPKYYAHLRVSTSKLEAQTNAIRRVFIRLKETYPSAVFPDVYLLVGKMNSGGVTSDHGLLIGVDMYGRAADTDASELDDWLRVVLRPVEDISLIVAHELMHFQQQNAKETGTVLQVSLTEGSADFVARLVAGRTINDSLMAYGREHERELWTQFQKDMDSTNFGPWLYNGDSIKDRPANLGYFMGYRITEEFYRRVPDKEKALEAIFHIQDFKAFLHDSHFTDQFTAAKPLLH